MRATLIIATLFVLATIAAQPAFCDNVVVNNADNAAQAAAPQPQQQHHQERLMRTVQLLWKEKKEAFAASNETTKAVANPLLQNCVDLNDDCSVYPCCAPGTCCQYGADFSCSWPSC